MALRIDWDGTALYLTFETGVGRPLHCEFPDEDVVLDRDADDRLVGVELLGPRAERAGDAIRGLFDSLLGEELADELRHPVAA